METKNANVAIVLSINGEGGGEDEEDTHYIDFTVLL